MVNKVIEQHIDFIQSGIRNEIGIEYMNEISKYIRQLEVKAGMVDVPFLLKILRHCNDENLEENCVECPFGEIGSVELDDCDEYVYLSAKNYLHNKKDKTVYDNLLLYYLGQKKYEYLNGIEVAAMIEILGADLNEKDNRI